MKNEMNVPHVACFFYCIVDVKKYTENKMHYNLYFIKLYKTFSETISFVCIFTCQQITKQLIRKRLPKYSSCQNKCVWCLALTVRNSQIKTH